MRVKSGSPERISERFRATGSKSLAVRSSHSCQHLMSRSCLHLLLLFILPPDQEVNSIDAGLLGSASLLPRVGNRLASSCQ